MPLFCSTIFFTFQAQSLFKQAAVSLSFLPCNVSHFQTGCHCFHNHLYFSCHFSFTLLYIKPLVSVNKQFSIDSFLVWDFCLSHSSHDRFCSTPPDASYSYCKSWCRGNASRNKTNEMLTLYLTNTWGFIP